MKTKLIAALWLLFSFQAFATTATITGTIRDLSGAVVTSGQVTFQLMPGLDTTISGTARFVPSTVTCGINGSGLVKNLALSAACTLTTNTSLLPAGTWYQSCIWPVNVKTSCFSVYIIGDLDISTSSPTPTTSPIFNLTAQTLVYNSTGTQITNSHVVIGSCILGTSCAVTLTGSAVFTASNSYVCEAQDTTAAAATKIAYTSGTQFTFTGTGTDSLTFMCIGN